MTAARGEGSSALKGSRTAVTTNLWREVVQAPSGRCLNLVDDPASIFYSAAAIQFAAQDELGRAKFAQELASRPSSCSE